MSISKLEPPRSKFLVNQDMIRSHELYLTPSTGGFTSECLSLSELTMSCYKDMRDAVVQHLIPFVDHCRITYDYHSIIDMLVSEFFVGFRQGCINYYSKCGPRISKLYDEKTICSLDERVASIMKTMHGYYFDDLLDDTFFTQRLKKMNSECNKLFI